jgi:hypothetical protein
VRTYYRAIPPTPRNYTKCCTEVCVRALGDNQCHLVSMVNAIAYSLSTSTGTVNSISMFGLIGGVHVHDIRSTLTRRTTANIRIYINLYARALHDSPCFDYICNMHVHHKHKQLHPELRQSMCSPKRTSDRARDSACSFCNRRSVCLCKLNVVVQM